MITSNYHCGYTFLLVLSFVQAYCGPSWFYTESSTSITMYSPIEYAAQKTIHVSKHWGNHLALPGTHFRLNQMVQMKSTTRIRIFRWANRVDTLKSLRFVTTILIKIKRWQRKLKHKHTQQRRSRRNLSTILVFKRKCASNDNVSYVKKEKIKWKKHILFKVVSYCETKQKEAWIACINLMYKAIGNGILFCSISTVSTQML